MKLQSAWCRPFVPGMRSLIPGVADHAEFDGRTWREPRTRLRFALTQPPQIRSIYGFPCRHESMFWKRSPRPDITAPPWLAAAEVVRTREEIIARYVAAGDVLDLGAVDARRAIAPHCEQLANCSTLLHERIRQVNPGVVGVDVDREGVQILRQRGYNVLAADVETMELGRQFDVVVGGEVLEHLPNPGRALATIKKHLKPGGRLLLSTVNPFCVEQWWKILRYGDIQVHEEHLMWFDPRTLGQLLAVSGFEVERLYWLRKRRRHGQWKPWLAALRSYVCPHFLIVARASP